MRPPGPVELFRLLGRTRAALELALGAVPQLVALVNELNALVVEARAFIVASRLTQQQAAQLVAEVETTRREVHSIIDSARRTEVDAQRAVSGAGTAVLEARKLIEDVRSLMERFDPALRKLAPVVDSVAEQITVEDAEALTALARTAPELVDKLSNDVVPVLDSLDTVGADLREVVDTTQQMDEMLGAVPGLGRVKKRIERRQPAARRQVSPSPRLSEQTSAADSAAMESLEPVEPVER